MVSLSPAAVQELRRLQRKQSASGVALRLGVQPSQCAGVAYQMKFDTSQPGDRVYEADGFEVVIDADSLPFLEGLTLDYSEDLMGGGFRFHNPNAARTCGCGNSFALKTAGSDSLIH